jgi:hypothetical protein
MRRSARRVFRARVEAWCLVRASRLGVVQLEFQTVDVWHLWPREGVEYQRRAHASSELRRWVEETPGTPVRRAGRTKRGAWVWVWRAPWADDAAIRAG